jgi:hypothetical protein
MSMFRWAVVVSNLAMSGLLVAMAAPQLRTIAAQLDSGYVPDDYWINIALVIVPFALAALILWGLVVWSRGSRRLLVLTDLVVTLACWSVLVLYVFVNDLPIVAMALSPIALILAAFVPHAQSGPGSSAEPSAT